VGSTTRAPKPAPSSATWLAHSLGLEVVAEGIEDQPALETAHVVTPTRLPDGVDATHSR
jgi:hypothetical protein